MQHIDEEGDSHPTTNFHLILRKVGLKYIVPLYKFYGLNIDADDHRKYSVNWIRVTCMMILFVLGFLFNVVFIFALIQPDLEVTFREVCICTILTVINIRLPASYIHCIYLLKRMSISLNNISIIVDRIKPEILRQSTIKKIHQWSNMTIMAIIITTLCGVSIVLYGMRKQYMEFPNRLKPEKDDAPLLLICSQIFIAIWYIFGNSFLFVCSTSMILICKVLLLCFDCYIPVSRTMFEDEKFKNADLPLCKHQYHHERLSKLVEEINNNVSIFMLSSLAEQLIILILYSRSGNADWLIGIFLSLKQTIMFLLDTMVCSAVNDKVDSCLTRTNIHSYQELKQCSAEHINWAIYMNQCIIRNAKLTYGNIFGIHKSFIITVAGTTLTYTLVLKDIGY